jgi:GTP-binding protein
MLPVVALIGRPNVGKSTLFNRLTRSQQALVADLPGLTRDRQYGYGKVGPVPYIVIDTGGLTEGAQGVEALAMEQSLRAVTEADLVLFMCDARAGLTHADRQVATRLRAAGKRVVLVLNKSEGLEVEEAALEFHALGFGDPSAVSASHGEGIEELMHDVLAPHVVPDQVAGVPEPDAGTRIAVVGRPNVGKSTLVNRLLGEERVVASDQPGTTRDSIEIPFERGGKRYVLVDTAGVRRRARIEEQVEHDSVVQTLQAIDDSNVVIALLDASEGVTEHDAALIGIAVERGRALVIGLNKWDGLDADQRDTTRRTFDLKLPFVHYATVHNISALHGTGVGELMRSVESAWTAATRELTTTELNKVLEQAVTQHQPPMVRGRRIKLRYAHQGGKNPPVIVVHGNQTEDVPDAYRRYLENKYREAFALHGTPVRIEFRTGHNPFKGRRNPMTARQVKRRQRLKRHHR